MKSFRILFVFMVLCACSLFAQNEMGGWYSRESEEVSLVVEEDTCVGTVGTGEDRGPLLSGHMSIASEGGLQCRLPEVESIRIQELARGLNYDWEACYRFVYDNIAFAPYFGLLKGPERTLLDREGNDADQAFLLHALLMASGYSSTVLYEPMILENGVLRSSFKIPALEGAQWIKTPHRGTLEELQQKVVNTLASAGYSAVRLNRGTERWIAMDHFLVSLHQEGESRFLDPSFKQTQWTAPRDVAADMGYQRTALLAAAGGTVSAHSVQNVSQQGLENVLCSLATTLEQSWNASNAFITNYIDAGTIEPHAGDTFFGGEYAHTPTDVLRQSAAYQNAFRASVSLMFGEIQQSFFLDEVGSRHLWIRFSSTNKASLYLDDTLLSEESSSSQSTALTLSVVHLTSTSTATYTVNRGATNVYVIPIGFDGDAREGMRTWATEEAAKMLASGIAENDVRLKARGLQMVGQQWLSQAALVGKFRNSLLERGDREFYRIGVVGQNAAPFMDIANCYGYSTGDPSIFCGKNLFYSALEHAVLDQVNGRQKPSVSTVKILELANVAGNPIFFATAANFASIRGQLQGYSTSELNRFQDAVSAGDVLLLPRSGNTILHQWSGYGYVGFGRTSNHSYRTLLYIAGGMRGGFGSSNNDVHTTSYVQETMPTTTQANGGIPEAVQADPVAMPSGAYLDRKTDLVLHSHTPLIWARNYDSRARISEGDLGRGWSHNFEASITECADPDAVFGRSSVEAAIPTAVAMTVVEDLLAEQANLSAGEMACRWTLAALTVQWWTKQLTDATVSINLGAQSLLFHRRPDGSFAPYPGVTASLTFDHGLYTLTERHGSAYDFNADKQLSRITDRSGNITTLTYNANKQLIRIANAFGVFFDIAWANNRISQITDSAGRTVRYAYSADGCLTSVTDPLQKAWTATYDPATFALLSQTDSDGHTTIQNTYNGLGQVIEQIAANGQTWTFGYVENTHAWDEDPAGNRLAQSYTQEGRVVQRTDRDHATTQVVYDGHGHVIAQTDPLGRTDFFEYDAHDNLRLVNEGTEAQFRLTGFAYDSDNRLIAITNALGDVTTFEYDACDRLLSQMRPDGSRIVHSWSPNGCLLAMQFRAPDDTLLRQTAYTYGPLGLPITRTITGMGLPSMGIKDSFTYTATGLLASYTDAEGHTASYEYDARGDWLSIMRPDHTTTSRTLTDAGRLASLTNALGRTTSMLWNPSGTLSAIQYPDGSSITNTYDALDRLVSLTDARGSSLAFTRDPKGRILTQTSAMGTAQIQVNMLGLPTNFCDGANVTTSIEYDDLYRPCTSQNALGSRWQTHFDLLNRPIATTNPRGKTYSATYDSVGQQLSSSKPSGATTRYGYDGLGNCIAVTNAEGHVTTQSFDALGRLLSLTDATGHTLVTNTYDGVGNITNRVDGNGASLSYTYDACNRLTHRTGPEINDVFSYDAIGNLLSATNDTAAETFSYDAMNCLSTASSTIGSQTFQTAWCRDAGGFVTNLVVAPGKAIAYTYTADGLLSSVSDGLGHTWTFAYNGDGKPTGGTAPDGTTHSFSYDAAGQLSVWSVGSLAGRIFELDPSGRRIRDTVTAGSIPSSAIHRRAENMFDAADRNTSASIIYNITNAPISETYLYDGNGALTNVLTEGASTFSATYTPQGQLASLGTDSFAYDALGNRVLSYGHFWIPNHDDPLKRPLLECAPDGTILRIYIWAPGRLLGFLDAQNTLTIAHSDEQGNVIALTDSLGTILHTAHYGPHGEDWGHIGTNPTPFSWMGGFGVQSLSTPSSLGPLYLTRYRLYFAILTRFLSFDPLGLAGGLNLYAYANNNPLLYFDPLGLCAGSVSGAFVNGFFESFGTSEYWHDVGEFYKGYGDAAVDTISGLYNSITHPLQTLQSTIDAISHPLQTATALGESISESWESGPRGQGKVFGDGLIIATTVAVPYAKANHSAVITVGIPKPGEATVIVSRWGRPGLHSGDFVMKGEANLLNYVNSGKMQLGFSNRFAPFRNGETFRVPASSVQPLSKASSAHAVDNISEPIKKVLGQRAYIE